jgi:hypothetical protein
VQLTEVLNVALAGLGALAVYVTPGAPGFDYLKAGVLGLTAALQYVLAALDVGDLDIGGAFWAQVIATAIAAVLVGVTPQPALPQPPPAGAPSPTTA